MSTIGEFLTVLPQELLNELEQAIVIEQFKRQNALRLTKIRSSFDDKQTAILDIIEPQLTLIKHTLHGDSFNSTWKINDELIEVSYSYEDTSRIEFNTIAEDGSITFRGKWLRYAHGPEGFYDKKYDVENSAQIAHALRNAFKNLAPDVNAYDVFWVLLLILFSNEDDFCMYFFEALA